MKCRTAALAGSEAFVRIWVGRGNKATEWQFWVMAAYPVTRMVPTGILTDLSTVAGFGRKAMEQEETKFWRGTDKLPEKAKEGQCQKLDVEIPSTDAAWVQVDRRIGALVDHEEKASTRQVRLKLFGSDTVKDLEARELGAG